jgi:excinuclease ABC subunit A
VYLRCQDCNGQRYRPEILEIKIERNRSAQEIGRVIGVRYQLFCGW